MDEVIEKAWQVQKARNIAWKCEYMRACVWEKKRKSVCMCVCVYVYMRARARAHTWEAEKEVLKLQQ